MLSPFTHGRWQNILRIDQTRPSEDRPSWILFVLSYAVFANIPFWAACRWLGLWGHGLFCLEYVAVGLLALIVRKGLAAALLVLVIASDVICGVSRTYYLSPWQCLMSMGDLHEFGSARLLQMSGIAALAVLIAFMAASLPVPPSRTILRRRASLCLVGFAVSILLADCATVVYGTGTLRQPDSVRRSYIDSPRLSRPVAFRLIRSQRFFAWIRENAGPAGIAAVPVRNAASLALRSSEIPDGKGGKRMPNLVLILVESWGIDTSPAVQDALTQPYFQPEVLARYQVSQGAVPFQGATINGEGRELCGSSIGFRLLDAASRELQACLPSQLGGFGYHSLALHGMDGRMFDRKSWYKNIGFDELWFGDRFRNQQLPDCDGAFVGTCDAAIAEWIGRRLQRQDTSPDFVYWVTLNSHLPVPVPTTLQEGASCSISPLLSGQPPLCSWYQLIANVHSSVARLAVGQLARPTVFIIVGDHAPPFSDPELRGQFSSSEVPYILLTPLSLHKGNEIASTTPHLR